MIEVVDLSLKLNIKVSDKEIINLGYRSYNLAQEAKLRFYNFPEGSVHVWVEQGSVSYKTKIYCGLLTLINFVSNFDGFVGGVEKMVHYSNKAMDFITNESINYHKSSTTIILSHNRSTGFPGKIKTIMVEVSKGNITPDEATLKVEKLLEQENEDQELKDQFTAQLQIELNQLYRYPSRQLELYPTEAYRVPNKTTNIPKPRNRTSSPTALKPPLQGVEIWQDPDSGETIVKPYLK